MGMDTLQKIAFIIGLITATLALLREVSKIVESFSEKTSEGIVNREISRTGKLISLIKAKSILDLSFVILCSAFFSLLLTDALIISGRSASSAIGSILTVFFYSFFVVTTMIGAWLFNQSEKVVGFWAITTLIVLIIAPGGPFNRGIAGTESGLSVYLIVPVIILLTLAATMLIYSFGNPLSKNVKKGKRLLVFLTLASLIVFAAIAVGIQIDNYVEKDVRTPDFPKDLRAKELTRKVMKLDRTDDKRLFYQLASEIALADSYQNSYYKNFPQPVDETPVNPQTPASTPAPALDNSTENRDIINSNLNRQTSIGSSSANISSRANTSPSPQPSPPTESKSNCKDLVSDMRKKAVYEDRSSDYLRWLDKYGDEECNKIKNKTIILPKLKLGASLFNSTNAQQKSLYLLNRIPWIHPAGLTGSDEAVIPLPHRIPEDRLKILSEYRMIKVLRDDDKERENLFTLFTYPPNVRKFYGKDTSDYLERYRRIEERETERRIDLYTQLYPRFQENDVLDPQNTRILREQLSIPLDEEIAIAFKQYQLYAREHIKNSLGQESVEAWLITVLGNEDYNAPTHGLDEKSQRAINYYIARIENLKRTNNSDKSNPKIADILRILSQFYEKGIEFQDFIISTDPTKITSLESCLDNRLTNLGVKLKTICENIKTKNVPQTEITNFKYLLRSADSSVPIEHLLSKEILVLADELNRRLQDEHKDSFILAVSDPIWYSAKILSEEVAKSEKDKQPLTEDLIAFRTFNQKERQAVLHQLAITLYKPGGEHSLNPISSMIAQFKFWHDDAGWICATILCMPFLIAVSILGGYFARILVTRDRMREILESESSEYSNLKNTLGTPVDEVFGREETLAKLKNLAERGWSTIGVVGRRGVGKSRVLHAMSMDNSNDFLSKSSDTSSANIRVWISSPSKFSEYEFVISIFERLALSTEEVIAKFLGAKPLATRTIESKIAVSSTWTYVVALFIMGGVVFLMFDRLSRWDIAVIWIPILVLLFTSLCLFANYISKIQPINLTSWLQRERNENPHTYLLYREVYKVLASMRNRSQTTPLVKFQQQFGIFRLIMLSLSNYQL